MATTISGSSGVTFPAGGTGNPAGTVVGTTDTQTLTNKTLTSPTMTGAVVSSMASSVITAGTAVASTSGTSIDFTSIPSWVKRITVMFNGVSTNGTSNPLVQIGSGSVTSSGYTANSAGVGAAGSTGMATSTAGFVLNSQLAANTISGHMIITNVSGNTWVSSHSTKYSSTLCNFGGGDVALSGVLDRVRITTAGGSDTFDAGSINILYE